MYIYLLLVVVDICVEISETRYYTYDLEYVYRLKQDAQPGDLKSPQQSPFP